MALTNSCRQHLVGHVTFTLDLYLCPDWRVVGQQTLPGEVAPQHGQAPLGAPLPVLLSLPASSAAVLIHTEVGQVHPLLQSVTHQTGEEVRWLFH